MENLSLINQILSRFKLNILDIKFILLNLILSSNDVLRKIFLDFNRVLLSIFQQSEILSDLLVLLFCSLDCFSLVLKLNHRTIPNYLNSPLLLIDGLSNLLWFLSEPLGQPINCLKEGVLIPPSNLVQPILVRVDC